MTPLPTIAVVYGQPDHLSTSFQTRQFAAALDRWFSPIHLSVGKRSFSWLGQFRRLILNYLRPALSQPAFEYILYGNDGFVDFRYWTGQRILYWYDAPADWSKQPPAWTQWTQQLRYRNVRIADHVFCVSHAQLTIAQKLRPGSETSVHYLPVGVDCSWFDPQKSDGSRTRTRFELHGKTVVGYLGYLSEYRGRYAGQQLAEAAPLVVAQNPDVRFLVVGFGPAMQLFQSQTAVLGLRDRFLFSGYIPNEDLPDAIASMDICVDTLEPGFHSEARSETKLKQYMAMARPCVATAIGENRVDLDEGQCGVLVAPGCEELAAAITDLCRNPGRRLELGARARARALALYDWRYLAEKFALTLNVNPAP